ncbi:2Fe-2S iron-sulfur cluster binding domain-containing protein [Amycolatopsis sp. RM579]|uniref:2Fe-2S iron-sulfur cluster binding domain-containing protein n=1 Tax=Amycolatopsis pithecellobii TaxID=664692 RepID=A0A6N7YN33_9PSEU|nr:2Fe-2S iron-sulfur cluster binding domain-containing protein [Amycolatopsis pithecellobii]
MREVRVSAKSREAEGVVSFELSGDDLPSWSPGAHVDVGIGPGLVRQYSLCGAPGDRGRWRIAVLREETGRGGSRRLHDVIMPGDTLLVGQPRNNFPLEPAPGYVFVAGGIGITPLLPMIAEAERLGAEWTLYYGGRHRARMAFTDELARHGERVRVLPEDECGLLPLADIVAGSDHPVYCCGPEPLLAAAERVCPPRRLRLERFHPREITVTGRERESEVVASISGQTITVAPGESILDALDSAGVPMPSSCREGTCGTCETAVLEGEVEHRDSVLSDAERAAGKTMMVCVSRARSARLVLDV